MKFIRFNNLKLGMNLDIIRNKRRNKELVESKRCTLLGLIPQKRNNWTLVTTEGRIIYNSQLNNLKFRLITEETEELNKDNSGDSLDSQVDRFLLNAQAASKLEEDEQKNESEDVEPAPKLSIETLNVNAFAADIARLIENFETLLEFKDTLIKRSLNFIQKSYDKDTVDAIRNVLESEFDLQIGVSNAEKEADLQTPNAIGAGAGGGGGAVA